MEKTFKCVANLGDADYIENGGFLVLVGEDGEVCAEVIEEPADECEECEEPSGPDGAAEKCEEEIERYRGVFARYPDDDPAALDREIAEIRAKWAPEIAADVERAREVEEWRAHVAEHERWTVYRFDLDRYESEEAVRGEWFGDDMESIAASMDVDVQELVKGFMSEDPVERAWSYREVCEYHGIVNFDQYPLTLSRPDVEKRYEGMEVPR